MTPTTITRGNGGFDPKLSMERRKAKFTIIVLRG